MACTHEDCVCKVAKKEPEETMTLTLNKGEAQAFNFMQTIFLHAAKSPFFMGSIARSLERRNRRDSLFSLSDKFQKAHHALEWCEATDCEFKAKG